MQAASAFLTAVCFDWASRIHTQSIIVLAICLNLALKLLAHIELFAVPADAILPDSPCCTTCHQCPLGCLQVVETIGDAAQAPASVTAGFPCSMAWHDLNICASAHDLCLHVTLNNAVYHLLKRIVY